MQDETIVDGIWLVVHSRKNDREDIRFGGLPYLGYVFLVEETKKEVYKEFVLQQMNLRHQQISPLSGSVFFGHKERVKRKELANKTSIARQIYQGFE